MSLKYTSNATDWNSLLTGPPGIPGPTGALGFNRNRIINGEFSVNQRGFTSTTVNGTIGADLWRVDLAVAGGTVTHSIQYTTLRVLPEAGDSYLRIVTSGHAAAGEYAILAQRIESVRTLAGHFAIVSFWARAVSGTPKIALEFIQNFGTGGSPSGMVIFYGGQVTISTNWARYHLVVTIPSIVGKVLGTTMDGFLDVRFWVTSGSTFADRTGNIGNQNNTFDIWGVQVEEGDRLTPFEHRRYADTLFECQRYFQRWKHPPLKGAFSAGTSVGRLGMPLSVPMRVTPTITISGPLPLYDGVADITLATVGASYSSSYFIEFDGTYAGTSAQYRPAMITQYSANANYMDLNAELV